ncbi:hypothetical protein [Rhizobium sp.]|jgi:hypothetical protein|uniref:hypothetical protein n=1 Tax=Rhizobium sp. TaxID=391 RepID=UPI000E861377|nr:hypothetical protein [Rhizobium sp.]
MTSISSLNASSAAMATAAVAPKPSVTTQTSAPTTGSSNSIGSSSAANVPSSIAALSLRGAENDAGSDKMVNGHEVNDHDGDD